MQIVKKSGARVLALLFFLHCWQLDSTRRRRRRGRHAAGISGSLAGFNRPSHMSATKSVTCSGRLCPASAFSCAAAGHKVTSATGRLRSRQLLQSSRCSPTGRSATSYCLPVAVRGSRVQRASSIRPACRRCGGPALRGAERSPLHALLGLRLPRRPRASIATLLASARLGASSAPAPR